MRRCDCLYHAFGRSVRSWDVGGELPGFDTASAGFASLDMINETRCTDTPEMRRMHHLYHQTVHTVSGGECEPLRGKMGMDVAAIHVATQVTRICF